MTHLICECARRRLRKAKRKNARIGKTTGVFSQTAVVPRQRVNIPFTFVIPKVSQAPVWIRYSMPRATIVRRVNRRWDPLFMRPIVRPRPFVHPSVGATTTDSWWVFGRRSSSSFSLSRRVFSSSHRALFLPLGFFSPVFLFLPFSPSMHLASFFLPLRSFLLPTGRHGGLMKM